MAERTVGRTPPRKAAPKKAVVKRKGGAPVRHPWDQVRAHFVEQVDEISLKDLADTYGISYGVVRVKAAEERWSYLRAQHQADYARQVARQRIKTQLIESENFDDQSLKAAKTGQSLVAGRMAQIAQLFAAQQVNFNSAVARMRAGQHVDKSELYSAINYKELNELAAALERFQSVGRRALGTDFMNQDLHAEAGTDEEGLDIGTEMGKGDIDRLAALMEAMERAGLNQLNDGVDGDEEQDGDDDIVDAEVVPELTDR